MDLRPSHVEGLRDRLLAEGKPAPQSVADVLRVLSQALSRAEAKRYVGKNVASAQLVDRPAWERSSFGVIDAETAMAILDAVRGGDPWDIAAHLAIGLGLRREEVLGLRHFDCEDEVIHVRQTLTYAAGGIHFGPSEVGRRPKGPPDP
jgi:integrase